MVWTLTLDRLPKSWLRLLAWPASCRGLHPGGARVANKHDCTTAMCKDVPPIQRRALERRRMKQGSRLI